MTDKNIKHGKRNSDYWDRLIERYYSGNTTIDEEKELSRFVFSESQNKRYDEIRAVLSYSLIGNSIKGKIRSRQRVSLKTIARIAACIAIILSINILYFHSPRDICVTYRNRYRTNETHRIPVRPNQHYRGERTEFHIQASRKFTINSSSMKMFYKIFISCIFLWIGNICHAQKGLAIAPLFSGKYDKDEQAIVVLLKGKTLHPYGLSLFHSISITDRPDDVTLFEAAVSTDSRKAENSETVKSGNNTIAGYYQLPPAVPDGENRFILFRKTSPHDATLIYLEGQTQLDKLINLFINKKQ